MAGCGPLRLDCLEQSCGEAWAGSAVAVHRVIGEVFFPAEWI
jgi:hypothetical protein